jgi:hypothetical protein
MYWQNTGSSKKTNKEVNWLIHKVLRDLNFKLDDLDGFNATHENWKANTANEKSTFLWSF